MNTKIALLVLCSCLPVFCKAAPVATDTPINNDVATGENSTRKRCPFSNDYARQHIVCVNQTRVVFKKLAPNTTDRTNVVGYLHANSKTKQVDVSGFAEEGSGAGSQLVDSNEIFCIVGVDRQRFIATADGHSVGVDERGILVVKKFDEDDFRETAFEQIRMHPKGQWHGNKNEHLGLCAQRSINGTTRAFLIGFDDNGVQILNKKPAKSCQDRALRKRNAIHSNWSAFTIDMEQLTKYKSAGERPLKKNLQPCSTFSEEVNTACDFDCTDS